MPRDLFPALTKVPTKTELAEDGAAAATASNLNVYTQMLTPKDVDSCTELEEAAFPPQERATREKFLYRIGVCPELCLGIFTSGQDSIASTVTSARPVDSATPERKAILLGHIVSTKGTHPTVTDNDMAYPKDGNANPELGHKEHGRTVCIHSLAILPEYQKQKLGTMLMKAYIERLRTHKVADRLALIAHDHLISFYERLGFKSLGASQAQFGGGGWYDMMLDLE